MERKATQLDSVSYEVFEIIVDRLEKEWFDLMKRIPPKPMPVALGPDGEPIVDANEDIGCAICDDGECENSNAIVFCDGCNLAVHQDCYGIPYIPEGQWLCRKCTVSPDRAVSCVLCPHEGGAFKQTTQGKWAHLLCAMWIPETGVSNPVYMEPIDSIERIPKARWRLQCYLCRRKVGACIQCDNKNCFTAFHVTCARRAGLLLKTQRQRAAHSPESDENEAGDVLRAWCHKHLPKTLRAQRQREEEYQDARSQPPSPTQEKVDKKRRDSFVIAPGRKKSARAYKKSYRSGPSLVPACIVERLLDYISRISIRKKHLLVLQIAKFWSLKREARRGAPLLKRLHLEPWTAFAPKKEQSDAERVKKLNFLLQLREDLEKVRMLAELTRKREKEKQRQVQVIRQSLVEGVFFPYHGVLRGVLDRIIALDRSSLFLYPVSQQKVPDYYEVISHPMDWTTIAAKVDELRYTNIEDFKADINLVIDNAMLYNKIDTHYHRTASRIRIVAEPIFTELDKLPQVHGTDACLQLEPERSIVELLQDVDTQNVEDITDGFANNVIDDVLLHFYQALSTTQETQRLTHTKTNVASRRSTEKAARSERGRLAYQKRLENKRKLSEMNDQHPESSSRRTPRKASVVFDKSQEAPSEAGSRRSHTQSSSASGHFSEIGEIERYGSTDLEVNQVDSWDSFKLFNTGWVLPNGLKRSRSRNIRMNEELGSSLRENNANKEMKQKRRRSSLSNNNTLDTSSVVPGRKRSRISATKDSNDLQSNFPSGPDGMDDDNPFEVSTLCWAKLEGYPFFPAEIFDAKSEVVPANVQKSRPAHLHVDEERIFLVRFFDNTRTFGWIAQSKLRLLFEDEELDQRMLKAPRLPRHRKEVRQSYDRARTQAE